MEEQKTERICWHCLFGGMLEKTYTAPKIKVNEEVSNAPPRADVVIWREANKPMWSEEDLANVPDGLRDINVRWLLMECKFTESFNLSVAKKVACYEEFFRATHKLAPKDVLSAIVVAKTPNYATLEALGFTKKLYPGVYVSTNICFANIRLIVLNQLRNVPHNALVRVFAKKKKARNEAIAQLEAQGWNNLPVETGSLVHGLLNIFEPGGAERMGLVTVDSLIQFGKEHFLSSLEDEEFVQLLEKTDFMRRTMANLRQEGLEKGRAEGRAEGRLSEKCRDIIEILVARFGIDEHTAAELETQLATITDTEQLRHLLHLAVTVEQFDAFNVHGHNGNSFHE